MEHLQSGLSVQLCWVNSAHRIPSPSDPVLFSPQPEAPFSPRQRGTAPGHHHAWPGPAASQLWHWCGGWNLRASGRTNAWNQQYLKKKNNLHVTAEFYCSSMITQTVNRAASLYIFDIGGSLSVNIPYLAAHFLLKENCQYWPTLMYLIKDFALEMYL